MTVAALCRVVVSLTLGDGRFAASCRLIRPKIRFAFSSRGAAVYRLGCFSLNYRLTKITIAGLSRLSGLAT